MPSLASHSRTVALLPKMPQKIAPSTQKIVPTMVVLYLLVVLLVLINRSEEIIPAILLIVESAFAPKAVLGGAAGVTILVAIQMGVGRGVFSNEAGLGSSPIAAAAAKTKSPVKQGLISMTGTFFTMLVCTVIGLTIVLTGSYGGHQEGAAMTTIAFERGLPIPVLGKYVVNIGLIFFAFTTILGWNYYGEKCMEYLMGIKSIKPYRVIFISLVAVGSFLPLGLIFIIADIVNGLMAIPNLIGIIGLRKEVVDETRKFFIAEKEKKKQYLDISVENIRIEIVSFTDSNYMLI